MFLLLVYLAMQLVTLFFFLPMNTLYPDAPGTAFQVIVTALLPAFFTVMDGAAGTAFTDTVLELDQVTGTLSLFWMLTLAVSL